MIVQNHKAEEGAVHIVLFGRELPRLFELLGNPKKRVSKEAKAFGQELRSEVKNVSGL